MGEGLALVDLLVILAVMAGVTWLGHRLSGSIKTRRSFLQSDGTLPWWAVSASILATLVSAVTFVSVPAAVFAPGGDLTYFQVILGLALGKIAVGLLLARPFYQATSASTSYEYIGQRIDKPTGEISMYLGLLLTIINSGVKLLTASLVLDVITGWGLPGCALFVVLVSVLWGALAGIKTVIWTDFLLFLLFSAGALFALLFISMNVEQSLGHALASLDAQAKLVLFDFSTDPEKSYTIWAGVIGGIALNIAQGSTQGTWQRVRSCRSVEDAQKAYNFAALFYVMHLIILAVGLALAVFYSEHDLPASVIDQLSDAPDRIFPYFIVTQIPVGLSGLFIAAIFAAAISTLDSALAESSDLSVTHIYAKFVRQNASERHYVLAARTMMVLWGMVFFAVALFFGRYSAEGLLNLTFKLPNYVYGAIFGSIVLARFGIGRLKTMLVGFVVATAIVVWMSQAGIAFFYWCPVAGSIMVLVVWALERTAPEWSGYR
jgi:solute:Na+ symporter, SSS family